MGGGDGIGPEDIGPDGMPWSYRLKEVTTFRRSVIDPRSFYVQRKYCENTGETTHEIMVPHWSEGYIPVSLTEKQKDRAKTQIQKKLDPKLAQTVIDDLFGPEEFHEN